MQKSILSGIGPSFRKVSFPMLLKPPFQLIRQTKDWLTSSIKLGFQSVKKKYWYALCLGMVGNLLVNVAFNLKYQRSSWSFSFEEYYLAIAVSLVLLSVNQGLTGLFKARAKQKQFNWVIAYLLSSAALLNLMVVGITYAFYNTFYTLSDLLIINLCFVPLTTVISLKLKPEFVQKHVSRGFWSQWTWISSVLLGISVNTVINLIFDYKYQRDLVSTSLEEYLNAILAAHLLLSGTRWISRKLDKSHPWKQGVIKRLLWQVGSQFIFIVLGLNTLVIGITHAFYGGGYSLDEMMVINISMITLTILFSGIDSSIYFFKNWNSDSINQSLANGLEAKPILVSLGKKKHIVEQSEIKFALSQSGLTLIHTRDGRKMPYTQSLEQLYSGLDQCIFFRANRQVILNRNIVKSYKSLPYGKLEVEVSCEELDSQQVHISRTRATEFRKWLGAAM